MPRTISKGRIFSCTVEVPDALLAAMKKAPDVAAAAMQAGAEFWHDGILPKHFEPGAGAKYGYAPRSLSYLRSRLKAGKPLLVFSGSMRHDLTSRATYKQAAGGAIDVRMTARVLNLATNMPENSPDLYVKHKNGRGYPNLKREVKTLLDDEREAVAAVATSHLQAAFNPRGDNAIDAFNAKRPLAA